MLSSNKYTQQELLVLQRRLEIEKQHNERLREDINEKFNPERIEEWRSELSDISAQEHKLCVENTTLKLNIRRVTAQFQLSDKDAYEKKIKIATGELNSCKEKLTLAVARHNSEEKTHNKVVDHTGALEDKVRALEDEINQLRKELGLGTRPADPIDENSARIKELKENLRKLTDGRDEAAKAARADSAAVGAATREIRDLTRLLITRDKELAEVAAKREKAQMAIDQSEGF